MVSVSVIARDEAIFFLTLSTRHPKLCHENFEYFDSKQYTEVLKIGVIKSGDNLTFYSVSVSEAVYAFDYTSILSH
jgi:hypothetical protein